MDPRSPEQEMKEAECLEVMEQLDDRGKAIFTGILESATLKMRGYRLQVAALKQQLEDDERCYDCNISLPEPGAEGIIYVRSELREGPRKYGSVSVCRPCFDKRQTEEVRDDPKKPKAE